MESGLIAIAAALVLCDTALGTAIAPVKTASPA